MSRIEVSANIWTEDLSEEDRQLKEELDMLVERINVCVSR